jgi:hypothetical protein
MDEITDYVGLSCGGRRLFITKQGCIGLSPPRTLSGDRILIVPGIDTPIILMRTVAPEPLAAAGSRWMNAIAWDDERRGADSWCFEGVSAV